MNRPHHRRDAYVLRAVRLAADAVVAAVVALVLAPVWLLPWRPALTLGRWYGYVAFLLYPAGRRTGQINLRQIYGDEMSRDEARRQTRAVFGSLAQALAEGLQFARRFPDATEGWDGIFDVENTDLHRRILADSRTKIFVGAHHGSWEIAMMAAALRYRDGAAFIRGIDNPFVDALLRWARRSQTPFIEKRGGAAAALERLRQGSHVAMMLDENAGPRGVWVDFFGRPASTQRTAALLAIQTGCPIVVGAAVRRPAGRYLYRLALIEPGGAPGPPARVLGALGWKPEPDAVTRVTGEITAVLERWIREDPLQWRWIHWRWKTRPDRSEERYGRAELRACFARRDAAPLVQGERRT